MANNAANTLLIVGSPELITSLKAAIDTEAGKIDFSAIMPVPAELRNTSAPVEIVEDPAEAARINLEFVMRNLADARRERDAAVARAEQAERERDEIKAEARKWIPAHSGTTTPSPAVSIADIQKVVADVEMVRQTHGFNPPATRESELVRRLWALHEGTDRPASAVSRAELENARLERDGAFENYKRIKRERDAAVERAEKAEARIEGWREAHDALMENPCPVTLDEIATVLERTDSDTSHGDEVTYTDMADAVLALLSGSDRAVYVVRNSEVAAVPLKHDRNGWDVGQTWYPPLSRGEVKDLLAKEKRAMVRTLAIARAIGVEAEQSVDPIEERVDALADAVYGDELVTEQMRGVLKRLVRSGWILPEGVECK